MMAIVAKRYFDQPCRNFLESRDRGLLKKSERPPTRQSSTAQSPGQEQATEIARGQSELWQHRNVLGWFCAATSSLAPSILSRW